MPLIYLLGLSNCCHMSCYYSPVIMCRHCIKERKSSEKPMGLKSRNPNRQVFVLIWKYYSGNLIQKLSSDQSSKNCRRKPNILTSRQCWYVGWILGVRRSLTLTFSFICFLHASKRWTNSPLRLYWFDLYTAHHSRVVRLLIQLCFYE